MSSILIEVIILYDFVLNYLSLSSIAKSKVIIYFHILPIHQPPVRTATKLPVHPLRRPDDRLSIPEREPRSNEPTDLRVPPGIPPWELDGIAGNKVGGFVFVRHAFRHVYKFVIHCLSLHLFACQSFKFRCNVGIHYAFQARALSPDYIINL